MMITRHFIDVSEGTGKRRVHYRKAGNGPPLLMVHQSPRSSKEYEALMLQWAAHFTCIAPDTPGFGQSDPLAGEPAINEFADATVDFLDALGIEKCAAYGFHSGGIILVTAVKRHANRFTTLAVGGYAIWSPEEMELFRNKYLPPFHPSEYGEHLSWLWNRILEQSWFFPWFATDEEHRLSVAHADPVRVDAVVREMLDAGNAYKAGYGAVLHAPRDIPAIDANVPPCLISAYNGDPLQEHIDRLGRMPADWSAQKVETPQDHHAVSLDHLLSGETPLVPHTAEAGDKGFVHIAVKDFDGLIHWRKDGDTDMLTLHAPGRDMDDRKNTNSLVIDLPGHGLSHDWIGDAPTNWGPWQAVINAVAERLKIANISYAELPKGEPDALYPDLSPDRFGHYLTAAWQIARARHFFSPWYEANVDNAIAFSVDAITPENLAREHRALLNARAAKAYHLALQARG